MREDIAELVRGIKASCNSPLICIGSGGSFSGAVLTSWMHQELTGQLAFPATPLQAARMSALRNCGTLILSAGGRNPDVLGVLRHVLEQEPRSLGVICLSKSTPLAALCAEYRFVHCAEFSPPAGKDGFVATNSLLALLVLIWRAYGEAIGFAIPPDLTLERLLQAKSGISKWSSTLAKACEQLWARKYLLVLHGAAHTQAAAFDLESKFSEAAIGGIQITDYRNFAHGRHHWLDKKAGETSVLALISRQDETLATKTLALVPKNIALARVGIKNQGFAGGIEAVTKALYIAGFAAVARGIDAGRPHVPDFGRRIYHLNAWSSKRETIPADERVAIERKIHQPLATLIEPELEYWRTEYRKFLKNMTHAEFNGLIVDYDGTLCDERFRFTNLPATVSGPLNDVVQAGVLLGIATGRGKSVRKALRESISRQLWGRVVIAYYNGSEIGTLDDDAVPEKGHSISPLLQQVETRLRESRLLQTIASYECKNNQISVIAKNAANVEKVYNAVCDLVCSEFELGVSCVRSSHSVDILARGITKLALLDRLANELKVASPRFLCIGDLGSWPGNDCLLLSTPYSLSCDQASTVPDRCWNLAPVGQRNSQATEYFLQQTTASRGTLRVDFELLFAPGRRKGA